MNILAIDPSLTCWGIATGDPMGTDVWSWKPPGKGVSRLRECKSVAVQLAPLGKGIVVIEGYSYGSKGRAVFDIGELGGVLRLALHMEQCRIVEVPPSSLKKWATSKGNAGKDEVLASAIRRLGYEGHSNDEADALWMLHMAGIHYAQPWAIDVPASHKAGCKVQWPT